MAWTKRLEKIGKRLGVWVLKVLYRPEGLEKEDFDRERVQKILIVRLDDRIGNLVLITPLIRAVKAAFPEGHLALLAGARFAELLSKSPDIDELIVLEDRNVFAHPIRFFRFLHHLRTRAFDLALDASSMHGFSFTHGYFTHATHAPFRVGYDRKDSGLFLNLRVPPLEEVMHETELHLNLLRYLVADVADTPMRLCVSQMDRRRALGVFTNRGIGEDEFVGGMHLGGRRGKRWLVGRFAALADRLRSEFGVRVVVLCGPDEEQAIRLFDAEVHSAPIVIAPSSVGHLAALIERCHVFISGDTGPMHMAVALEVPTIAIFKVNDYCRYGPRGESHRIVYDPEGKVGVEDVLFAFRDMMKQWRVEVGGEERKEQRKG
ncbi:MAG: glycosyltransferase family 9 protein [Candidatus Latescibacterota bacterium]